MEVEDGRHFRNDLDDSSRPVDWEVKLRRALATLTASLSRAKHRKERLGEETPEGPTPICTCRNIRMSRSS